jgi:hypothetical protein
VTCRSSVRQAACVYSLIRPLRIGFRRICCVPTSVTAARGATRSSSGARAGRCPGAAGPCCSAAGIRPGRRAGVPRRGSARGRGARGAGCRRGVRRSRSAWTAVRRILAPVARKTASKERVKSGPRSRIRNLMSPDRSPGAEGEVAGLLHSPLTGRVCGDAAKCIRRVPCSMKIRSGAAPDRCPQHAGSPTPWRARPSRQVSSVRRGSGDVPAADSP